MKYYITKQIHLDISEFITDKMTKEKIIKIINPLSGVISVKESRANFDKIVISIHYLWNNKVNLILRTFKEEYDYWLNK